MHAFRITWSNLFDDTFEAVIELLGGFCNTLIARQLKVKDTLQVALTELQCAVPEVNHSETL